MMQANVDINGFNQRNPSGISGITEAPYADEKENTDPVTTGCGLVSEQLM
jgi:hypothetical protein